MRTLSGAATFCLILGAFVMPSRYVMEGPGPMFNVLGQHEGTLSRLKAAASAQLKGS